MSASSSASGSNGSLGCAGDRTGGGVVVVGAVVGVGSGWAAVTSAEPTMAARATSTGLIHQRMRRARRPGPFGGSGESSAARLPAFVRVVRATARAATPPGRDRRPAARRARSRPGARLDRAPPPTTGPCG
jgi:hypothetical protein